MPCEPHALSATAAASRTATAAAIFALNLSLMRRGIYSSGGQPARDTDRSVAIPARLSGASPVLPGRARRASSGRTQKPCAVPGALSARNTTTRDDGALLGRRQLPNGLRVCQLALLEDRLGGGDAQLLGDERDRQRQERVEIEQ